MSESQKPTKTESLAKEVQRYYLDKRRREFAAAKRARKLQDKN